MEKIIAMLPQLWNWKQHDTIISKNILHDCLIHKHYCKCNAQC